MLDPAATQPWLLIVLTVVALLVFHAVGTWLARLFRLALPDFFGLFVRTVTGMVVVVSSYAVLSTRGNTVLWLLLLAFFMAWRSLRSNPVDDLATSPPPAATNSREWLRELLLLSAAGTLLAAIRLPLVYNFASHQLGVPYHDFVYYARLTFPLNELGVETNMVNPVNHGLLVAQPYHYLENWLNALLVRVSGLLSIQTLYISTYSTLLALAYLGYCAIYRHFGQSRRWALALGLVSLPLTGLFLPLFKRLALLENNFYDMSNLMFVFPKLTVILVLLLLAYLLYLKQHETAAIWLVVAVPVTFVSTAPALMMAFGLWAIYRTIRTHEGWRGLVRRLGPGLLIFMGFGLFYFANARLHSSNELQYTGGMTNVFATGDTWRHAPNFLIGLALCVGAYNFVYGLLLLGLLWMGRQSLLTVWRRCENVLVFTGLIFFSAAICWVIFMPFYEGWQFYNNITLAAGPVAIVVLLANALTKQGLAARLITLFVLGGAVAGINYQMSQRIDLIALNYQVNPTFLQSVRQQNLTQTGGFILDSTEYIDPFSVNSAAFSPGLYMSLVRNNVSLVSLSQLSLNADSVAARYPEKAASLRRWIEEAPITQFYQQARLRNPNLSREEAQRQFVLRHRINFVCVSKAGRLPASLQPLVQTRLEDAVTGEKFYLLRL